MIDAIDDRDRAKRMTEARQDMNCTYAGRMPGKITLSKILKVCEDIGKNLPERIIDKIEISPETAILMRSVHKENLFYGTAFYVIPELKVPYKIIYLKKEKIYE